MASLIARVPCLFQPSIVQIPVSIEPAASLVVGAVLARSALAHINNPYYFLASVYKYELVSPAAAELLAMMLPFVVLVTAVCLISRIYLLGALSMSIVILSVFFFAQVSAIARELPIACGCFGPASEQPIGWRTVSGVGFLWSAGVIGVIGLCLKGKERGTEQHLTG